MLLLNFRVQKKPKIKGDISKVEYRFNNFSKSSNIKNVNFKDILPKGLLIKELPDNCSISDNLINCQLGDFKPKEKKPIMLENLRNIFYRMELSDKETRILSSVFASLGKKR